MHIAPAEAQTQWRQVGDVCFTAWDWRWRTSADFDRAYSSGEYREPLTRAACALGGEMVTPIGQCEIGRVATTGVYVRR
jgi:hypothetical protein